MAMHLNSFLVAVLALSFVALAISERCNGQGNWYTDTQRCECFNCFSGDTCEVKDPNCVVISTAGDPRLFQEYWHEAKVNGKYDTNNLAGYRANYQAYIPWPPRIESPMVPDGIHKVLVPLIRNVHDLYGNAKTKGYFIVPGYGATQLIAASMYAFSAIQKHEVNIFAQPPYYDGYVSGTIPMSGRMKFNSSHDLKPQHTLEFVTTPNNPTGEKRTPVYPDSFVVYDLAYYWPSLTTIDKKLDGEVMIFTLSKLTGHAGTRFGWALVKNPVVAAQMALYMSYSTLPISADVLHRAYRVLQNLVDYPYDLFNFIGKELEARWSTANSILGRAPDRFNQASVAGTFYMFIECLYPEEAKNCAGVFASANITAEKGSGFGVTNAWARIEMVETTPTYNILMDHLNALVGY